MRSPMPLAGTLMVLAFTLPAAADAQEREDRTLLNHAQMRAIINEASGERAMQHLLELVPYQRVRPISEYAGTFRETDVTVRFAKAYGYSDVGVESFPTGQRLWQPSRGQLWLTGPGGRKLFDIFDTPVAMAVNTPTHDITADVIDVGNGGRAEDYVGKDVKGKIVLGSAGASVLQRLAVFERGAVGVLSWNNLRIDDQVDAMLSQSISAAAIGSEPGFGWSISPRAAREIATKLGRGETVTMRSLAEAEFAPGELEVVHAVIKGDGSSNQVVMISAHLYEGYIKQGANDDNSGVALTLEMGRAYIQLIKDGLVPRPKRDLHFLWVPEISGTNAWLTAHPEIQARAIADLNFDMEGIRLSTSGAFWVMHRTPDTFPTFLNDVGQSFLEFVAETNRERVRYRAGGYAMTLPIVSQNGSRDPFYIKVDKYYGSSDHATYMSRGIPALMFITWPDPWYHSSQDTPDKTDPTQFKRAAVVGIGAMAVLAGADDPHALRVVHEVLGRGAERMGDNLRKGLSYLADVTDAGQLRDAYLNAKAAVRHQAEIEKAVLKTAKVLFADPAAAEKKLAAFEPLIEGRARAHQADVTAAWKLAAMTWGVPAVEPVATPLERRAALMIVDRPAQAAGGGGRGGAGGGAAGAVTTPADRDALTKIPGHMTSELNALLGRGMSVLAIRDFIGGEFEPLPLEDVVAYFEARARQGTVVLRTPASSSP